MLYHGRNESQASTFECVLFLAHISRHPPKDGMLKESNASLPEEKEPFDLGERLVQLSIGPPPTLQGPSTSSAEHGMDRTPFFTRVQS